MQEWDEAAASFQRAAESYKLAGNASAAALALKDAGKHMLQSGRSSSDDIISVLTDSLEMSANISDQQTLGNTLAVQNDQLVMFIKFCIINTH